MDETKNIGWVKFYKPKDTWYSLTDNERKKYFADYKTLVDRVMDQNAKLLGTYKSRGQSGWERFEVWEFPDLQVLVDFTNGLEDINHYLYFLCDHTFGRKYEQNLEPGSWVV